MTTEKYEVKMVLHAGLMVTRPQYATVCVPPAPQVGSRDGLVANAQPMPAPVLPVVSHG